MRAAGHDDTPSLTPRIDADLLMGSRIAPYTLISSLCATSNVDLMSFELHERGGTLLRVDWPEFAVDFDHVYMRQFVLRGRKLGPEMR